LVEKFTRVVKALNIVAGVNMHQSGEVRKAELTRELEKLKKMEPEIGAKIGLIVMDNWADGRVEKFFESKTEETAHDYICRVVNYYQTCWMVVTKIESADFEAWKCLLEKLRKWAYVFLRNKGLPHHLDLIQIANDCANDAGGRLMNIRFPFDVHYDSWCCRVVHNVCYNYIRQHAEKIKYVDLNMDLSETDEWLRGLSIPDATNGSEMRLDLLGDIEQLNSEDRKRFIMLYYFEGRSFAEIAEILERTHNALYKLHFDSLENLRKILGEKGYNIKQDDE
jgi:RNA polymerase sigma factor (sigma-70 family)